MSVEPRKLPLRVVKVGGSLFDLPDLRERLWSWLDAQPLAINILLAGGGELADVIRRADERHGLGESTSHWLCVELLSVTANWLARLIGQSQAVSSPAVAVYLCMSEPAVVVFDPRHFLGLDGRRASTEDVPESWKYTSDSISARLAIALHADELVLLKSCAPPDYERVEQLANAGYVDEYLPSLAAQVPQVRFENLRD